jgi:hypothetical protein
LNQSGRIRSNTFVRRFASLAVSNPRADIGHERRRQIQVRKALETALSRTERAGHHDLAAFYLACGDYLVWSMDRLHDQDQLIHDLLRERLPASEQEARKALAGLGIRQQQSRELVRVFRNAVERLRCQGRQGVRVFETAARRFTKTFSALLAPRRNPFEKHTDRLFKPRDWVAIAWVSDGSRRSEHALFAAVQVYAPEGIDPAGFPAEHLPG